MPVLGRLTLLPDRIPDRAAIHSICPGSPTTALALTTPVAITLGENGTGKSILFEAVAVLAGYHETGAEGVSAG